MTKLPFNHKNFGNTDVALYYVIGKSTTEINDWWIHRPTHRLQHTAIVSLTWPCSVMRICRSSCSHLVIQALILNLEWQLLCLITNNRWKVSAAAATSPSSRFHQMPWHWTPIIFHSRLLMKHIVSVSVSAKGKKSAENDILGLTLIIDHSHIIKLKLFITSN